MYRKNISKYQGVKEFHMLAFMLAITLPFSYIFLYCDQTMGKGTHGRQWERGHMEDNTKIREVHVQ